jgi:hypothetical protein
VLGGTETTDARGDLELADVLEPTRGVAMELLVLVDRRFGVGIIVASHG